MHIIASMLKSGLENKDEEKAKQGITELETFAQQERNVTKLFKLLPIPMIALILISSILILLSI